MQRNESLVERGLISCESGERSESRVKADRSCFDRERAAQQRGHIGVPSTARSSAAVTTIIPTLLGLSRGVYAVITFSPLALRSKMGQF